MVQPATTYRINCSHTNQEERLKHAVIGMHQRVWHGQKPDELQFQKRSDGSYSVKAIVFNRETAPKITLFEVSSDFTVSRV